MAFNIQRHKALHTLVKKNYDQKLMVIIKGHDLHSFNERVILLCHSGVYFKQDEYHIYLAQLSFHFL